MEVIERAMCLLAIKVPFPFIALMQKRLHKQITATLNVRVQSSPQISMEIQLSVSGIY